MKNPPGDYWCQARFHYRQKLDNTSNCTHSIFFKGMHLVRVEKLVESNFLSACTMLYMHHFWHSVKSGPI